jgi:hypothetical protein
VARVVEAAKPVVVEEVNGSEAAGNQVARIVEVHCERSFEIFLSGRRNEVGAGQQNTQCAGKGSFARRFAPALKDIESTTNTSSNSRHFGKLENSENHCVVNRLGK